jgi:LysR family nitrogen assimilation transcriptional regulator
VNLKQLAYFRKALKCGNLTRAAQELNVAQTALGLQIRNLEQELGQPLLERHSRGVTATPAGLVLDRHAAEILDRVDAAKVAVRAQVNGPTTVLRLGLTPSIVRLVGDVILTELAQMLPDTQLLIVEEFSFILVRQLAQGDLSCMLGYWAEPDPRFDRRALLEEDLVLMVAPGDARAGEPVTFREALEYELAFTDKQDVVTRTVQDIADRIGSTLNIAYQVQSLRAVKNLVSKSVAASIMPFGAAEGELRSGDLVARPIVSPPVTRTLALLTPRDRSLAARLPELDAFVDAIADRLHAAEGPLTRRL